MRPRYAKIWCLQKAWLNIFLGANDDSSDDEPISLFQFVANGFHEFENNCLRKN